MHRDVEKGELRQASQAIYLQNVKKKKTGIVQIWTCFVLVLKVVWNIL